MIHCFKCEYCGQVFNDTKTCLEHEISHYPCSEQKREILAKCNYNGKTPCDYCKHAYYVYGCEFDCEYKNKCNRNEMWPYWVYKNQEDKENKKNKEIVKVENKASDNFKNISKEEYCERLFDFIENVLMIKLLPFQKETLKLWVYNDRFYLKMY